VADTLSTSVPIVVFGPTGVVVPTESAILAGVQADMNAAFGGGLNPGLSTPQGQLASSLAAVVGDKNDELAWYVSQVDPDIADGRMQDAIGRIYFINRLPAVATVVAVLCTGLAGTLIPAGSKVVDSAGNTYSNLGAGTIPVGGSITLQFACDVTGPVVCAIGQITGPYRAIAGWDTAANAAAGVTGSNVETRANFEYRRRQSVALNAAGSLPSIYAAVFNVPGVLDVYVRENTGVANLVIGSITLLPHSIYVAAVGGLDADVANAIWLKKNNGADYNGNTTVAVSDASCYAVPYPTYNVTFQRPTAQPILFAVQIANAAGPPSDIVTQVKNAIISAFAGGDNGPRVRIGSTVYASRFYGPVSNIKPGYVEILSLLIGTSTATLAALTLDIGFVPTVSAANITVTFV
jgi:uncharacterized phage protein gp47/JayE